MTSKIITTTLLLFSCSFLANSQKLCDLGGDLPPMETVDFATKRSTESMLEIPVVFHVVGNSDLHEDIDTTELADLIEYCNRIFRAENANLIKVRSEFEPIIGIANINFKIEEIVYIESNAEFIKSVWGPENNLEDVKNSGKGGSDPRDTEKYLNIWICNVLNTNGSPNDFNSSYATPPENAPGWPDFDLIQGVLIDDLVVSERKYILPHELGHYLGLRHVMEISQNNCKDNDGIEDTPPCSRSPECSFRDSCPGGRVDMVENFMNPQVLSCRMAFTKGQTSYMRNILEQYRPSLYKEVEVSMKEKLSDILIYPNAVSHAFNIEFEDCNVKFVDLYFYSSNGYLVRTDRFATKYLESVDISEFTSGVYFVCVKYNDKIDVKKVIKI